MTAAGFAIGFSGPGIDALCGSNPLSNTKGTIYLDWRV